MKTAIEFLIEWTEGLNWKNYLLNCILQNKNVEISIITEEIIDIISNDKTVDLITSSSNELKQTRLIIKNLDSPININALCSDASCELGKQLNVFYGENGSGKSSYVKIFRKLADNYYTLEKNLNIRSNIYTTSEIENNQTITICYSCDGTEKNEACIDINMKHSELSKINVFDSNSVTPLLNTDLSFSILPQGLNYFSELTNMVDSVKEQLQKLINEYRSEQDKIFMDSSFGIIRDDIAIITNKVVNISKLDEFLRVKYPLLEDINKQINGISKESIEIQNTNPVNLIKILNSQKTKLEEIQKSFNLLSQKVDTNNISTVNRLIKEYNELLLSEKESNEKFGNTVKHVKCVNNEWLSFIKSANKYYQSIGIELPRKDSECILCGQTLQEHHINLMKLCFQHINSEISQSKEDIQKKLLTYLIPDASIDIDKDEQLFSKDKHVFIEKLKTTITLIEKNKKIFQQSIENKTEISEDCALNLKDILSEIINEVNTIDTKLNSLGKSNQEVTKRLSELDTKKNEFIKVAKIHESKDLFRKWYKYKTYIDSLNEIKKKFTTNSLTTKSKEAFKEIVAGDYIGTFNKYCKKLGVPNVNISISSKKGQSKRGKYVVSEDIKVTEIMSEGEQKAIALSEFATDLKIRENYCTTIFDDPVTSFDYKRAEKIADLINEISKDRQVVVFTHNIMFYYYLYNCCCAEKNKENKFFKIDEFDRDNKGLISISAEGRLENLREITKKLKNASQKINSKKCLGDDLEQTLKASYSDIRTWCELIVEEGFLKKIIRRYEPDIKFTFVPKITKEFVDYLPDVSNLFNKSCRYMLGHSQPNETQNVKASREEFSNDLTFILNLSEKYKNQ